MSAGVVMTDGAAVLLGHATGTPYWDLPKGRMEPGETPLQGCLREVREETGLDLRGQPLVDLGRFKYRPQKDLHLFLLRVTALPDPAHLACSTSFTDRHGREVIELDRFANVPYDALHRFVAPAMARVLLPLLRE